MRVMTENEPSGLPCFPGMSTGEYSVGEIKAIYSDQPWWGTPPPTFPGGDVSSEGAVGNVISIPIRATMEREKQE
jgi:hypothetical protein